jgi:large conductance mechanosensitive channel
MLKDFRDFIARGNVLDLAVAVIIGAAFATITTSLTEDIIMPVVGAIFGGLDFSSHFALLGPVPADYHGSMTDYAALKKAGAPVLGWGEFLTVLINFLILSFIIFLMVRAASKIMRKREEAASAPTEVELLTEIRDELRKR